MGHPRTTGDGTPAVRVLLLTVSMAAIAAVLARRALHVVDQGSPLRVEACVELLALTIGVVTAAWLAVTSALALACVLARAAGRSLVRGERLVTQHAPALVRRAARVGVSMSVGAGLVLAGGTAHAAESDLAQPETAIAVDLGWRPSVADPGAMPDDEQSRTTGPSTTDEASIPSRPPAGTVDTPVTSSADGRSPSDGPAPAGAAAHGSAGPDAAPTDGATGGRTDNDAAEDPAAATHDQSGPAGQADHDAGRPTSTGPARPAPAPSADAQTSTGVVPANVRDAALTVDRSVPHVRPTAQEVVVVRGDSLWSITARVLPADASDAQIADSVERWYAANTDVIGGDPDLIRPGQILVPPTP